MPPKRKTAKMSKKDVIRAIKARVAPAPTEYIYDVFINTRYFDGHDNNEEESYSEKTLLKTFTVANDANHYAKYGALCDHYMVDHCNGWGPKNCPEINTNDSLFSFDRELRGPPVLDEGER